MAETVFYLETGSLDPAYNLAFEEFVLTNRREGAYLLLWQNDNTIVIGQNQNAEAEINRPFVEAHRIHVVRRSTGGGAVYHDLGNLNYSFITDVGCAEELTMERFTQPVVEALKALGLQAEASGRNDILVEGKKVSGTAQRVTRDRILHHGTLLFDADPAMVAGALHVDPEKFRSKSAKSVRGRIGNIRTFLKEDMDLPAFWTYLKTALAGSGLTETTLTPQELEAVETLRANKYATWEWTYGRSPRYNMENKRYWAGSGLTETTLTPQELEAVETLRANKYATWEWTYGRSPRYNMENKRYWPGGCLEVRADVAHGMVEEIVFYGDFLAVRSMEEITAALRGCAFRAEAFGAVLDRFALHEFFGAITKEEILETVFYASSAD